MKKRPHLTPEEIEAFGKEIKQLYLDTKSKVGKEDLDIAAHYDNQSKFLDLAGRTLMGLGGPLGWAAGVGMLSAHYTIEFSQGHNILHSQYDDIPGNEKFLSSTWTWDNTMDEEDWKFEHHTVHHPFTNVIGKDNDFGFIIYRGNTAQEWNPFHLFQLPSILLQPVINVIFFPWYVSTSRAISEKREILTWETYGNSLKKLFEHFSMNYILSPILAGPNAPKAVLGNLAAKIISDYHLTFILGISHLTVDSDVFPERSEETEGEYYYRQVMGTVNYEVPESTEILYGGINTHLEHHLFPDLPPNRLKELAPKVKAICEKYGIPYITAPFLDQIPRLLQNILENSLPSKPKDSFPPLSLLFKPFELGKRILEGTERFLKFWGKPIPQFNTDSFLETVILERSDDAGNVTHLKIKVPEGWEGISWEPGSYISVMVNINGKDYVRQYSLVKPPADTDDYEIAVKRIPEGLVSNYIADRLQENDRIFIAGTPKGDFTMRHVPEKILFMAAGIGITPLLSMLRSLRKSPIFPNVCFIYFNRSVHDISFHSEINRLASDMGIRLIHVLENPADSSVKERFKSVNYWDGKINRELLLSAVSDVNDRHIYICGPAGFMDSVKSILKETGYDFKKYHYENFRPAVPEKDPAREKTFRRIKFIKSDRETVINENTSLLEAVRGAGIRIPSGCLRGMCKACQVKKISGKTQRESQESSEKCTITSCNSLPRSDIELDI